MPDDRLTGNLGARLAEITDHDEIGREAGLLLVLADTEHVLAVAHAKTMWAWSQGLAEVLDRHGHDPEAAHRLVVAAMRRAADMVDRAAGPRPSQAD